MNIQIFLDVMPSRWASSYRRRGGS